MYNKSKLFFLYTLSTNAVKNLVTCIFEPEPTARIVRRSVWVEYSLGWFVLGSKLNLYW
jgi:hypothetical protein